MNTRFFMSMQALILGTTGVVLLFAPEFAASGFGSDVPAYFWTQAAAAGTLASAAQNWMGRNAIYGGIYGRPIVIGNMVFGLIVSLALAKMLLSGNASPTIIVLTIIYGQFGAGYAVLMFRSPTSTEGDAE